MDERRFDDLSRRLAAATTRRGGLKAALGALLGGAGLAAADAEATRRRGKDAGPGAAKKKRKKKCDPACAAGQTCVKGACVCDNGGTVCGANCCAIGQRCEGGQCASDPPPVQCIAAGEPCKATGRACCDGRVCASGQGGYGDVACYSPKTGACTATSDCVYGMGCLNGRCAPPAPAGLGGACDATSQQLCDYPGAVCTAYDGPGSPAGTYCTLPLGAVCTGDPECTCYKCGVPNDGATGTGREARDGGRLACCGPAGYACRSDRNCCLGTTCINGQCGCTPSFAVTDDPATNGRNLQAAIDAMQDGDTLLLAPGVYEAAHPDYDFFEFSAEHGHENGATYTMARCGSGDVVLRGKDENNPWDRKTLFVKGSSGTPKVRFTVVLRDITISSKHDPAADPTQCKAPNAGGVITGGGVELQGAGLVLEGGSRIVNACREWSALWINNYADDSSVVLRDDATIARNVSFANRSGAGVLLRSDRGTITLEDRATITGNHGMGNSLTVGGILVAELPGNFTATGVTAQNVFGNFAPNQVMPNSLPPCVNFANGETNTCYLP